MDQIFVFFPDDEKVGVKPIRSYSEKMQEEDVKKAIIVIKGGITPFARSAIQELCAQREVRTLIHNSLLFVSTPYIARFGGRNEPLSVPLVSLAWLTLVDADRRNVYLPSSPSAGPGGGLQRRRTDAGHHGAHAGAGAPGVLRWLCRKMPWTSIRDVGN